MWQRWTGLACVAGALLVVAGCGGSDDDSTAAAGDDRPVVVATTGVWSDVVSNVACGGVARVKTLVPSGGDPHSFEPSLSDRGTLESAALIVANGLLLEESLEDTIDAVEEGGQPVFWAAQHVETIAFGDGDDQHSGEEGEPSDEPAEDDDGHAYDEAGGDPHVWMDPVRVAAALPELADALVEHAGLDRAAVDACVTDYTGQLAAIDTEIRDTLGAIAEPDRVLVTNHDALGYFADRYDLEVLGTVIPASSTLAETNPGQLEELADAVEAAGVKAVFSETQHSDADVVALADRVGSVKVATLYTGSLGEPGSGAETYLGLLRTNAELIAEGLG